MAKWTGVAMADVCDVVRPKAEAKWAVFYSFGSGAEGGTYYEVHRVEHMYHHLTMLAYEMNDGAVPIPLRLRNEVELGFKQVKWVRAVEFVADFAHLGGGEGGDDEDHEFFGYRMSI